MRRRNLSSAIFIVLFLLPTFVGAFSIDMNLSAGEFYVAYRNADAGWRIEGSFTTDRNIEFFICDADNYTKWIRNESASFFEHKEETSGQSFNFTIPYNSTWYIVFSNTQSTSGVSLVAELFYIDQIGTTHAQVTGMVQSAIISPLLIVILVAILSVCILGIWISRRSQAQPAVNYDKILPNPS